MGIPDYLTCLLRNLYSGQEATVKTRHITDWFQIGKGLCQECHLTSLTYMQGTSCEMLDWNEAQAGIKIAGRNINNLRYAADTTLMAECEEEQKSLLMSVKEESEKVGLKLNIQKIKNTASSPITSWQIDGKTMVTVTDFLGLQNHCRWWLQPWNLKALAHWKESYDKLMTLRSRDISLPTKVCIVKAIIFPIVIFECENWTIKKTERWRIDAFELWCWRSLWESTGLQDQTSQS